MNNTNTQTIQGFREIHASMRITAESKTAREMALTPHNLNRDGTVATTHDGKRYVWTRKSAWVRFA